MIRNWIEARVAKGVLGKDEGERIKAEYAEEMTSHDPAPAAMYEDKSDKAWCTFRSDDQGIYLEGRCVKAMLKELSQVTGLIDSVRGSRQLWQHGVAVTTTDAKTPTGDDRLRFHRGNKPIKEADGYREEPVHAMTPQGPRTSIRRNDYLADGVTIEFTIWVLEKLAKAAKKGDENGDAVSKTVRIDEKYLARVRAASGQNGLGANRSQAKGRFEVVEAGIIEEKKGKGK